MFRVSDLKSGGPGFSSTGTPLRPLAGNVLGNAARVEVLIRADKISGSCQFGFATEYRVHVQ